MNSVPKTRWTARVDTLSAVIAKYKLILESLEQIQDTSNGDAKRDAGTYIRCCLLLLSTHSNDPC